MQIFNTEQVHAWDEFTIRHEPVSSIALMERASASCFDWLMANGYHEQKFSIFCGKGNNGGDGLAIARMLSNSGHEVYVHILEFGHKGTHDFQQNLALLHDTPATISFIPNEETIPAIPLGHVVIDAIFGSGLNRELEGLTATLVRHINISRNRIVAIDIPTGLFADTSSKGDAIIKANHTLTFQAYKFSFFFRESQGYTGNIHILDIGLHPQFTRQTSAAYEVIDASTAKSIIKKRQKFSHKGDYGSGALVIGSKGMMGAGILAARAFMRSGAGKLTCHIPEAGYAIMQTAVPEAMCKIEQGADHLQNIGNVDIYDAIGVGPGIGLFDSHETLLKNLFKSFNRPLVLDADALNILSRNSSLLRSIPEGSVLTPHTREFERIFGTFNNDHERITEAAKRAQEMKMIIVLKGPYTIVATPSGKGYINTTGNPGMATGGSGDVLTGIISGLLCQGYNGEQAATLGVYVHGVAGDLAAKERSMPSLIASDIIDHLGAAFKMLE